MNPASTMPRRLAQSALAALVGLGLTVPAVGALPAAQAAPTAVASAQAPADLIRIAGGDRYGTAAAVAQRWSPGVSTVYVSNGSKDTDSIAASARAGASGVPALLTRENSIPSATLAEIQRLRPQKIVIVGDRADVSESVAAQLGSLTSGPVERYGGADAYETAAALAETYPADVSHVYLAVGDDYPDALAAAAAAGIHGSPLLYTRSNGLPAATAAQLARLDPDRLVVMGGPNAVTDAVARQAAQQAGLGSWQRVGGADRYATAALIADQLPNNGAVWVAAGHEFADAAIGSALAATRGGPVLLTRHSSVPGATQAALDKRSPQWVSVFGGPNAISAAAAKDLAERPWAQTPPSEDPAPAPKGWDLQYSTDFSSLKGWQVRNETQDNDNSRNVPKNVVASSDGLTIHGYRESGYNRPYTSGEIHGTGQNLIVPNYFRAEVVAEVMDERGLWPAALWFRPVAHNDGEIDVMEYMGGRSENQTRKRFAVTMHNEYGATQNSLKAPIYIDELTKRSVTGVHKYTIEKTPGQIKVWIDDDVHAASVFKAEDAQWWDRIMEVEGREWYPRITLQIGSGERREVVPEPSSSWQHSEMKVHSLKLWSMTD